MTATSAPSDTLDRAIDHTLRHWPGDLPAPPGHHRAYSIGVLAAAAGQACSTSWAPTRQSGLVRTAAWAAWWISEILNVSIRTVWELVRAEYRRAHKVSPYRPDMSDDDRADWLITQVGMVADTPADHDEDLADALLQVATTATAWLAHTLHDTEEQP
ncbi:hypothetical protein CWT12_12380 [Actinomyces sp. 432]|uniref:hypothetical protein n=1 Tax=Actinomyces sp. 432 TaxID=2057798 RepID=UPI0013744E4C|nr:hypothetical protein [Actinomyces sp. 432]QHO91948.1 hypothetical protein CWT12_12380 [Actinomyces sp. 432]